MFSSVQYSAVQRAMRATLTHTHIDNCCAAVCLYSCQNPLPGRVASVRVKAMNKHVTNGCECVHVTSHHTTDEHIPFVSHLLYLWCYSFIDAFKWQFLFDFEKFFRWCSTESSLRVIFEIFRPLFRYSDVLMCEPSECEIWSELPAVQIGFG